MDVTITWQDNSDDENGFVVERQLNGGEFTWLTTMFTDATSYIDTTAEGSIHNENVYCYRVKAFNEGGESEYSNIGCVTVPQLPVPQPPQIPNAPTGLTATVLSRSEIRVAWNDQSENETGFQLERVANGQSKLFQLLADQTDYLDTGLKKNTWHEYRIRALGTAGPSTWTNTVRVRTLR